MEQETLQGEMTDVDKNRRLALERQADLFMQAYQDFFTNDDVSGQRILLSQDTDYIIGNRPYFLGDDHQLIACDELDEMLLNFIEQEKNSPVRRREGYGRIPDAPGKLTRKLLRLSVRPNLYIRRMNIILVPTSGINRELDRIEISALRNSDPIGFIWIGTKR